jgi:1-pyrroline-5-carboxylate dehydrogenase
MMREMKMGDPHDFTNFLAAVIDRKAFTKITGYVEDARGNAKVLQGGGARDDVGYFIEPTLVETSDPHYRLMQEEVFGPVVCVHPYPDDKWDQTLQLIDRTSPYGLTGAVFSRDRGAIHQTMTVLRNAAGNFYINDKPTGAIVAQQPFGGARASGTNDKAGSKWNLARWVSARAIKETFVPPRDFRYPYMREE